MKTRWQEYFEELYNDPNPVNESILNELHPSNRETSEEEPPILLDEVQNAIGRLKNRKAPGVDNITAEELQAGTQMLGADILHKLFQDVWDAEEFPPDWRKAIIVPIFKKKDKLDCNNYRGISLLCHSSKLFLSILLQRIRRRTDEILAEEQAGFRHGRSTIDQIFTLRQIAEKYMEHNRQLYVCYVDFRKAFDSIWRRGLWTVMRHLGYPEKVVRILESLYNETLSAVRVNSSITDWFKTLVGVMQGCVLSPILFCIFLEVVMTIALDNSRIGAHVSGRLINNLRFADDIAVLTESERGLQVLVSRIDEISSKMGMRMNLDKTECQIMSRKPEAHTLNVVVNGKPLNTVEQFIYLGGTITGDGSSEPDVKRRIGLASGVVHKLQKIWRSKQISVSTKKRVYECLVLSVLLYNSETWTLTAELKRKLDVFEAGSIRKIFGVSKLQHIKTSDLKHKLGITMDITDRIRSRRLRYFGHICRMDATRLPHHALNGWVTGSRARGRPRKRWLNNVKDDCGNMGFTLVEAQHQTQDRRHWNSLLRLSERAQASP